MLSKYLVEYSTHEISLGPSPPKMGKVMAYWNSSVDLVPPDLDSCYPTTFISFRISPGSSIIKVYYHGLPPSVNFSSRNTNQ